MIKRTLFFAKPYALSLKHKQLCIKGIEQESLQTVPIEDIGYLVIENQRTQLSIPLIEQLCEQNVAIIFCGKNHMPHSMLLPLEVNSLQNERFRQQISASEPLKKGLWKQIVKQKITNQARVLEQNGINSSYLHKLAKQVKSGDTSNEEAKAARAYWNLWKTLVQFPDFKRARHGDYPNDLLNYGYAILRAAVARALSGSGLFPSFGVFHRNKYNAFCLADDIMEPYRPFVDLKVLELAKENLPLNTETKARLVQLLAEDVCFNGQHKPFMLGLTKTSASLQECFAGTRKNIVYPSLCD